MSIWQRVIINKVIRESLMQYFSMHGFTDYSMGALPLSTSPLIGCEDPSTLFVFKKSGLQLFLPQTQQLALEMGLSAFPKGVYTSGISYRKELIEDKRHLMSFQLFEFESAGDFTQLLKTIEQAIENVIKDVTYQCDQQLTNLNVDFSRLSKVKLPLGRLTYTKALKILKIKGIELKWGQDINSNQEKILLKHYGNQPLLLTHHPWGIKFFNMKINPHDARTALSCDLILPFGGETCGSAERETNIDKLKSRLYKTELWNWAKQGGFSQSFERYLEETQDLPPHSGGGIGIERLAQFILGIDDIRKVGARHDLFN